MNDCFDPCEPAVQVNPMQGGHNHCPPKPSHTPEPASWLVFGVLIVIGAIMIWRKR